MCRKSCTVSLGRCTSGCAAANATCARKKDERRADRWGARPAIGAKIGPSPTWLEVGCVPAVPDAAHLPGMTDMPPRELEPLLSLNEVSAYIGVPKNTLYRWRVDGKGPRAIKYGKHLRYRRSELEGWLEAHTDERPAA